MKKVLQSRRARVVASVVSGALVVGGCAGAALALADPRVEVVDEHDHGPGDGLSRYVLTLEPAATTVLDDAALASAVVPLATAAAAGAPAPAGAESLGPGGRVVQVGDTAYYVTDLGGVAVTPGASREVLSAEQMAQWASQRGVDLGLPGSPAPAPAPTPSPSPSSPAPAAAPTSSGPATDAQLAAIQDAPGVVHVQRLGDQVHVAGELTLAEARALPGVVEAEESAEGQVLDASINDPYYAAYGWSLENHGYAYQQPATADADVDGETGWLAGEGAGQVVAVTDTGFDSDHEDLAGRLWSNPACATDADGDGIRGDCHGWNFYANSTDVDNAGYGSHGTNVSGIVAMDKNNDAGSVGVAPEAKIMPLVIGREGMVDINLGVKAIRYAADHGATVINASWGGALPTTSAEYARLKAAIDYAGSKGVLVVAAAGNDAADRDTNLLYPASYDSPSLITVGSSTAVDGAATTSAYGARNVDLFAPGYRVFTTWNDGGYRLVSGTSMAAPQVAAAVALYRGARPDLTALQIKDLLLADTTRLPAFAGKSVTGGRLDLRTLGASATGATYEFSGMSGAVGALAPQVTVTAPANVAGAGAYSLSLGLAMQVDGEPWALADAPITLDGQALTTDDDGMVSFPLGSRTTFGSQTFAPGLSLGDGTYALVAQLTKDGQPVGRPYAAPLLVGAATEQVADPDRGSGSGGSGSGGSGGASDGSSGNGSGGSGGSGGAGGGPQPGSGTAPDRGTGGGSAPGAGGGSPDGGGARPDGPDSPGTSPGGSSTPSETRPADRDSSIGQQSPGGGSDTPRGGSPDQGSAPGAGGGNRPGGSTPEATSAPRTPSGTATPPAAGGGGADGRSPSSSPAPSAAPSPSGTERFDEVGDFDVTSLSPSHVPTGGGTTVIVTGRAFPTNVSVRVGQAAARVVAVTGTQVVFETPAREAGVYDVVVHKNGKSSTLTGGLTYEAPSAGGGPGTGGSGDTGSGTGDSGTGGSGTGGSGTGGSGTGGSGTGGSGGSGTGGSGTGGSGGSGSGGSTGPVTRTGPHGERLVRSAALSGVGAVWATRCATTCTGTRL